MNKITLFCFLMFLSGSVLSQEFSVAYDHTALRVADLDRSASFYSEVLQLKEIKVPYENPIIRWFSLGEPYQLHLIKMTDLKVQNDIASHLALHVDDFNAFLEHIKTLKIPYRDWIGKSDEIAVRPDGVLQVYIQDPDGHWIEINDASH